MATCPKGHTSTATDYCDECGAPLGGPVSAPAAVPAPPSAPPAAHPAAPEPDGEPCAECGTPRTGRFCEVCGHDFLAVAADPTPPAAASPAAAPAQWRVVVSADRTYYDRMRAAAEPSGEVVPFPSFCPQRRFELTGDQVLVGRRSRSRGIEPAIDLTGPPEDTGVSHTHALFVAGPGGWSVVDLDSANGTYLNDSADPLPPNEPTLLQPGDRVHVGAWTTLEVLP